STYNQIDRVKIVGGLPKGATGKVAIQTLRDILSGKQCENIYTGLTNCKYKRGQPSAPDAIRARIQKSLLAGSPMQFLSYWGCGKRDSMAAPDRDALDRLVSFLSVARAGQVQPRLTLLFTDVHGRINNIPEGRSRAYFSEIEGHARMLGIDVVY